MRTIQPIKIQLLLDGVQQVSSALNTILTNARNSFGGVSAAGKAMAGGVSSAQQAIDALSQRIERSNAAFEKLRQSGKLTAEQLARLDGIRQTRLVQPAQAQQAGLSQQQAALQVAGARDTLGVKAFSDIGAEIARVNQAYATLAASGKLTRAEMLQAGLRTQQATAELRAQTNGWAQSLATVRTEFAKLAGAAVGFTLAAREAIAFEAAMADVRKVVDGGPGEFNQITRAIRDLSGELPVSAVGLAQMAEAGGQLGIAGDKIPEFVRLASEMSVAFKMTAEESGNAVGKLGNIFGLTLPQVRALADSVNALGDSSAATERDIVNVLQRTGGLGRQFGLTAQQTSGLATAFLSLGDPPEIAATAINNLLGKLQAAPAQSADFQRTLKVLGIDARQLASDIEGDAAGALRGFLATLEKLDSKSRSQALSMMFGTGGDTASIAKLVGELGKLDTALQTATGTAAAGGLQRALQIQTETAQSQLKLLGNSVGDIGIALGAALLPLIKAVAQGAAAVAQFTARVTDAAPWLVTLAAVGGTLAAAWAGIRMAFTAVALLLARIGPMLPGVAGGLTALLPAGGAAAAGIGLVGAAVRALLGPVGLAITAVMALSAAWDAYQDSKQRKLQAAPEADLERERASLRQAAADEQLAATTDGGADTRARDRIAVIDAELLRRQRAREAALRESAGARGGAGDGYAGGDKADITARLQAATAEAQAAAKARMAADREAAAAQAQLAADTNARELAELQRNLERETTSLGDFYAQKRLLAEADLAQQIALKEQERAALQAVTPESAADREARRGQLAKLNAEITQLQRNQGRVAVDLEREQAGERLKLQEKASAARLATEQRGADAALELARRAQALGLSSAADLAAAEALVAERRVQLEVDAAQRILDARRAANAPADSIREAADQVDAARDRRRDQRTQRLTDVGQRVRDLREQAADIRLQLDADPARRAVAEAGRDIAKLRDQAEADEAVLRVQLALPDLTDEQRAQTRALLDGLSQATTDAVEARNDRLADDLKPGWQKMVEGWRDAHRLMRDAADETMGSLVRGGEDAFAQWAKTGRLSFANLLSDLKAQAGRTAFRALLGTQPAQNVLGALSSTLKPAAKEGDANFVGPLLPRGADLATGTANAPVQELASAAAAAAQALRDLVLAGAGRAAPGAPGAAGLSGLAGALTVKGYSAQEGDANFVGPLPEAAAANAAALDKSADAAEKLAGAAAGASQASTLSAAASAASAAGMGELSSGLSLATLAVTLFEIATKAAAVTKVAFAAVGAATGGLIRGPGTGTSDDVPAMLSNGEFVVRAAAVRSLGVAALERINQADRRPVSLQGNLSARRYLPAFAAGGLVGGATMGGVAVSASMQPVRSRADSALAGGITLNMVANVPAGASRNDVLLAMQQARREAVAEIENRMRRR